LVVFNANQRGGQYILLESLTKAVNKACGDMGKKIKFVVDGIDDEAIEKGPRRIIKETLMQLVRNSVAHGIETPENRIACGKDETGIIRHSVKAAGGNVHVRYKVNQERERYLISFSLLLPDCLTYLTVSKIINGFYK